jgi:uncharacterized membrane protein
VIRSHFDPGTHQGTIVLRPNQSWTWQANKFFLGTLLAVSLTIATTMTALGYWMILPYSLLEMGVLLACLYYCVRRTHRQEVLRLTPDQVVIERGVNKLDERISYERYFARFFVQPPRRSWDNKRLSLACRGQEQEIGSFLNEEEKDQLIGELRRMIRRLDDAMVGTRSTAAT